MPAVPVIHTLCFNKNNMRQADLIEQYRKLLKSAGVTIGGRKPYDLSVYNQELYKRIHKHGTLGLGEAYMDGWWGADNLEEMLFRVLRADLYKEAVKNWRFAFSAGFHLLINSQAGRRSYKNAQSHYDIGNELYQPMLGPSMAYSCGYWKKGVKNLQQAQEAKFELICQKLELQKGMEVLDIGVGWGGLAKYMTENYGVKVTGLTPAKEQAAYIKKELNRYNVAVVETTYQDYKTNKKFDRLVSVGMFEHVGHKNYKKFFKACSGWLKEDGIFLLHTIGTDRAGTGMDPWINKYIFPGGMLPALSQITRSSEKIFTTEDVQNFGNDYHKTLLAWYKNFKAAYPKLDHQKYDKRFYKMWEFYLLACAANFRARKIHLYQSVLTKQKLGTYIAPR